jgi:hypothetical protein
VPLELIDGPQPPSTSLGTRRNDESIRLIVCKSYRTVLHMLVEAASLGERA